MQLKERAKLIRKILEGFVPDPKPPLEYSSTFTLLIAVLLSAQCTDERVNTVTKVLFSKADTAHKMAQLSVAEIQECVRSCGLSLFKATSIKRLSEILVEKYGGEVPHSLLLLEELPGVGHKTASVVMAQAFHKPAFPVDTHIFRVARRWGLSAKKTRAGVERDLKHVFPKTSWAKLHLQMILFARKYCPAKNHIIASCPMCSCTSHENR